ncbi:hypothetical protein EHQ12_07920 [Leptospira gomenensis]|uniref:Uncharacterized protein n=1 Tax=Leptospira gomenensis TaxID=2484974 RepID=A0A5F1YD82_9LEPT|nr:hypothetical protein [Leptospira gomenensis]TGK36007.1 hypothetical protein EHQ17_05375 [Leptospira gomenensis]TGK39961.1 hypothetical protein EHQ12_07920 [Leptospira gomenensis]TGK51411.1 hypothetical protein EHQ07_02310 [Leptospira gomenensis]TGK64914.1 hypothetical protein EHQ13_06645 [Leptospira gomenensis]
MSDQTTKRNSEESANSISAKKDNFYSNHPIENEILEKIRTQELELLRIEELKPFLERLSSLPWAEYEEKLSLKYYTSAPFGKESSDPLYPKISSEKEFEFQLLEPGNILAEAETSLGSDSESFARLNNFVSNLIARTMGKAVAISIKKRIDA